ncbi:MAG: hypothetical protein IPM82_20565 [Saprospiraceae bacterium]|nr:hypothetical protein [Saprospiraceae bacterium]
MEQVTISAITLLPWEGDYSTSATASRKSVPPASMLKRPAATKSYQIVHAASHALYWLPPHRHPTAICTGTSSTLTFIPSGGTGTYNVEYSDGTSNFILNNISPGHTVSVTPNRFNHLLAG